MDGQKKMEAYMEKTMNENNVVQKDILNGMMRSENVSCSYEEKTITLGFPMQPWQANRVGFMHGGAICTAFDITMAALARFYARENFAPTVSLDLKYIRPVKMGDTVLVTAKALSSGKRITQIACEAKSKNTGKTVATGASIYLNIDTTRE